MSQTRRGQRGERQSMGDDSVANFVVEVAASHGCGSCASHERQRGRTMTLSRFLPLRLPDQRVAITGCTWHGDDSRISASRPAKQQAQLCVLDGNTSPQGMVVHSRGHAWDA